MKIHSSTRKIYLMLLATYCAYQAGEGGNVMANDIMQQSPSDASTANAEMHNMLIGELASYGIDPTPEGLLEGLEHKEGIARVASLRGLAGIAHIDQVPDIAKLCDDPTRFVRIAAVKTLHAIVSRHNLSYAEQIWSDSERLTERFEAALLLNELGDPSRYGVIFSILEDPEHSMFIRAVRSIPAFAKHQIVDENGETIDWIRTLNELLQIDNLSASAKIAVRTALQQIDTKD